MDEETGDMVTTEDLHTTYLERSRKELQKRIEQLKWSLREVCHSMERLIPLAFILKGHQENEALITASKRSRGRTNVESSTAVRHQLDAVAAAYRDLSSSVPLLPFPDSVVPALIALRTTQSTIQDSKKYLASQKTSIKEAENRLGAEKANLADQNALSKALETRIDALRDGIESRTAMGPNQIARGKITELKQQIKETDADTAKLLKALKKFIDKPLAAMLAAEETGGPVAGDLMDIDSDYLEAGFDARGKPKKAKADASSDKRQRKIDDMFSRRHDQDDEESTSDKTVAARDEMQRLTEELMNQLMAASGSSSDAYIDIPEESAAVRFLARVKVAEFHPRNSRRLRLVDFGREIED